MPLSMFRLIMVLMESMAGTGHKLIKIRPKLGDKLEVINFDPWGEWKHDAFTAFSFLFFTNIVNHIFF